MTTNTEDRKSIAIQPIDKDDPQVCRMFENTLSDGSKTFDVVFNEETVFCLDQSAAINLVSAVQKAVRNAQ